MKTRVFLIGLALMAWALDLSAIMYDAGQGAAGAGLWPVLLGNSLFTLVVVSLAAMSGD